MARAILLTGSVGSGKTTVLLELGSLLEGTPHALIDLDWLCWVEGASINEALARNLAAVASNYLASGIERLVLARFIEDEAALAAVRSALGCELFVARLAVPDAELEARLRARDSGAELASHLELMHSQGVAGDAAIENRSAAAAAAEVLRLAGW